MRTCGRGGLIAGEDQVIKRLCLIVLMQTTQIEQAGSVRRSFKKKNKLYTPVKTLWHNIQQGLKNSVSLRRLLHNANHAKPAWGGGTKTLVNGFTLKAKWIQVSICYHNRSNKKCGYKSNDCFTPCGNVQTNKDNDVPPNRDGK